MSQLQIKPISAQLQGHDDYGKLDPYIVIQMGNQKFTTQVCGGGGQYPAWKEQFSAHRTNEDYITFEVWEFDQLGQNEVIGVGSLQVSQIYSSNNKFMGNIPLSYKGRNAGVLIVEVTAGGTDTPYSGQGSSSNVYPQQPQSVANYPPGQYPPPQGQYPPPQGQYPPPQGQYPPPQGQYPPPQGQYPPPQGQYPPPPQGQYPPPAQGQYPTPQGQYPPPQGQYPPPQGQYPPPPGQYPPPQGQYPPPAQGQYPPPQQGQYPPPQYPPPAQGQYPTPQYPPQGQYPPPQYPPQGQYPTQPYYPPNQQAYPAYNAKTTPGVQPVVGAVIYRPTCGLCYGKGFYMKKHKTKPCKACLLASGKCPKCGGSGMNIKKHKPCKCIHYRKYY